MVAPCNGCLTNLAVSVPVISTSGVWCCGAGLMDLGEAGSGWLGMKGNQIIKKLF